MRFDAIQIGSRFVDRGRIHFEKKSKSSAYTLNNRGERQVLTGYKKNGVCGFAPGVEVEPLVILDLEKGILEYESDTFSGNGQRVSVLEAREIAYRLIINNVILGGNIDGIELTELLNEVRS